MVRDSYVIWNFPCWELGGGHTNVGNIFSRFPTIDFPICNTPKDLIFWIVTRASACDYTVY